MRSLFLTLFYLASLGCAGVNLAAQPEHVCDESCDHFRSGLEAARNENWPSVIAEFSKVLELRSDPATLCVAHVNRGRARLMSKDLDGALADFNAALKEDPKSVDALCWRASYWSECGDKERAIADSTRALEIDPKCASAYVRRGTARGSLKQFTAAVDDYTAALRLEPQNVAALLGRGIAKEKLGDVEGAIADLDAVLLADPRLSSAQKILDRLKSQK
jgi:tetratricopeptide (TPR) repeat protein